jgi:predicted nucleic acid-binding Zn ribbon protein
MDRRILACGYHPSVARRDLQSLRSLLPSVLGKVARESGRARHLQPLWREAVGETIARSSRPVALEGRTLVIAAATEEWARELQRKAPEIVARLQQSLGPDVVTSLRATASHA